MRKRRSRKHKQGGLANFERLEPRLLLTTLFGGETFEYQSAAPGDLDEAGPIVRVRVDGNATVELLAADVGNDNLPAFSGIPGLITESSIGRTGVRVLGGIGGEDGVETIGHTPIHNAGISNVFLDKLFLREGTEEIDFQAIATTEEGETFGINRAGIEIVPNDPDLQVIQVVKFDREVFLDERFDPPAPVVIARFQADLIEPTLLADRAAFLGNGHINGSRQAIAVDPTDGMMYVIAEDNASNAIDGADFIGLYRVDLNAETVTEVGAGLGGRLESTTGVPIGNVLAMDFDENGQLYVITFDVDNDDDHDAVAELFTAKGATVPANLADGANPNIAGALVRVDKTTGDFDPVVDVDFISIDGSRTQYEFSAMAVNDEASAPVLMAAARIEPRAGAEVAPSLLVRVPIAFDGSNVVEATVVNDIDSGRIIEGMAYSTSLLGEQVLVGMDLSQAEPGLGGGPLPQLLAIDPNNGVVAAISKATSANLPAFALTSFSEVTGERPVLYAMSSGANNVYVARGSAVSMPVDETQGDSLISEVKGADFHPGALNPQRQGIDLPASGRLNGISYTASSNALPAVSDVSPEATIAVGPDYFAQMVNQDISFTSKTADRLELAQPLTTFFASVLPESAVISDPVVVYDELADGQGRFVVVALATDLVSGVDKSSLLYAVSDTTDPNDGFSEMHSINIHEDSFAFPGTGFVYGESMRLGFNADAHVIAVSMHSIVAPEVVDHTNVISINKSVVLDQDPIGTPLTAFATDLPNTHYAVVPAVMHDSSPGAPMWLVSIDRADNTAIQVTQLDDPATAPVVGATTDVAVTIPFNEPTDASQPTGDVIDTGDTRVLSAAWRAATLGADPDRLVFTQTADSAAGDAQVRWYELDTKDLPGGFVQEAVINPGKTPNGNGISTFYPAIEIAENGDLGLTYLQSSTNEFLSMYITGQDADQDLINRMRFGAAARSGEVRLTMPGGSPVLAGPYGGIAVDPAAAGDFWATHQFSVASQFENNWDTFIANYRLITPGTGPNVDDGLLFLSASVDDSSKFFKFNPRARNRTAILNSIEQIGEFVAFNIEGDDREFTSIVWDKNDIDGSRLIGFDSSLGDLSLIWPGNPMVGVEDLVRVTFGQGEDAEEITSITGLAFLDDSSDKYEQYLYAIDGSDNRLFRIDLQTGSAIVTGTVLDIDDVDNQDSPIYDDTIESGPVTGASLEGLTYNPRMINPITGELGALLATDTHSDVMVFVDHRMRPESADVFNIFVPQADPDASIVMAVVPPRNDPTEFNPPARYMLPFSGGIEGLRLVVANNSEGFDSEGLDDFVVESPDGTGGVLIGRRTEDVDGEREFEELLPIFSGELTRDIGTRPLLFDDLPEETDTLSAGVTVTSSLLDYRIRPTSSAGLLASMLGFNFDRIAALAISRDGNQIVAIDGDGSDSLGESLLDSQGLIGDQISLIDLGNPPVVAEGETEIIDSLTELVVDPEGLMPPMAMIHQVTQRVLGGVQGMDFGDPNKDGSEEIYAIYDDGNGPTLGLVSLSRGGSNNLLTGSEFLPIGALLPGATAPNVQAMAFSPHDGVNGNPGLQGLYFVAVPDLTGDRTIEDPDPELYLPPDRNAFPILYEVQYSVGDGGAIQSIDAVHQIGHVVVDPEGSFEFLEDLFVDVGDMDFDRQGRLYVHDTRRGRLIDLPLNSETIALEDDDPTSSLVNPTIGAVVTGRIAATDQGSLPPTVGAISFDFAATQFLGADNSVSRLPLKTVIDGSIEDARISQESAILMTLSGFASDSAEPVDINKILIGGTVLGQVKSQGSMDTFYAGWILTGQSSGQAAGAPERTGNFSVAGDLGSLITIAPLGTGGVTDDDGEATLEDPQFLTGAGLQVGGKLGQVRTFDSSFAGSIDVVNEAIGPDFRGGADRFQLEVEGRPLGTEFENEEGIRFEEGKLFRGDGVFFNDSFETAQRLASTRTEPGQPDQILVSGSIDTDSSLGDPSDFYAISLLAGQTVTVNGFGQSDLSFQVYDPDGRIIASSSHIVASELEVALSQPIVFTTDRPGEHRIEVSGSGAYQFQVQGAGDIGLGGLIADRHILMTDPGAAVIVRDGDLGSLTAGGIVTSPGILAVRNGNLRSIDAFSIGFARAGIGPVEAGGAVSIDVPQGSVGLIRALGNEASEFTDDLMPGLLLTSEAAIGGDYQLIDSAGPFTGNLIANGGIGVIRAAEVDVRTGISIWTVNADGVGNDGIIDLIDVSGTLGSPLGGPQITTGPGGNVRYMRVGESVFQDTFFGAANSAETTYALGESVRIRDDGGGYVTLTPFSTFPELTDLQEATGAIPPPPGSLTVTTYGIRGSGGSVVVNVTGTENVRVTGETFNNTRPLEVSQITVGGAGRPVVAVPVNPLEEPEEGQARNIQLELAGINNQNSLATLNDLRVGIEGDGPVDVFDIVGGNFTSIRNHTEGEIVNVDATTVGYLAAGGNIGLAKAHTPAAVNGINILTNDPRPPSPAPVVTEQDDPEQAEFANPAILASYPFSQQRNGISAIHVLSTRSDQAIGNLLVSGHLGSVTANADRINVPDEFEGIAAPIRALGNINHVQIGEGVAPGGTGGFAASGIFAGGATDGGGIAGKSFDSTSIGGSSDVPEVPGMESASGNFAIGAIGAIVNQGIGSDIRGPIGGTGGIKEIRLTDGSIIETAVYSTLALQDIAPAVTNDGRATTFSTVALGTGPISSIRTDGIGGIIGSYIKGSDIGPVTVKDGFGILATSFETELDGEIDDIRADGYGIQWGFIEGGTSVGDLIATGRGTQIPIETFSPTVRPSEFDPDRANVLNDITTFLGDTSGIAGLIKDVDARASHDLGTVSAFQILNEENVGPNMTLSFANSIKAVKTRDVVDGLALTTGSLKLFQPKADVSASLITVAGRLGKFMVAGRFNDDSILNISGPNGLLNRFSVTDDFDGQINVDGRAGRIDVGGDFAGALKIDGSNPKGLALRTLNVGGTLTEGAFYVDGHVGTLSFANTLGTADEALVINGNLAKIRVGTDRAIHGSDFALDLSVDGDLKAFEAFGAVTGDIFARGDVRKFMVAADPVTAGTDILAGKIDILGNASQVSVVGGNLGEDVFYTVAGDINQFKVVDGDIMDGAVITSSFGNIKNITVNSGGVFGAVRVPNGSIKALTVSGADLGNNADPATIEALEVGTIRFNGSMMPGTGVNIVGLLSNLIVDGSVMAGATINAGAAAAIRVGLDMAGSIRLGHYEKGTKLVVGGNLGGTTVIDADTSIDVGADITADASVFVGRHLPKLKVGSSRGTLGTIRGNVFASKSGGQWHVGAVDGGVLTTGFDLSQLSVATTVSNSLIQAGIQPGVDGTYATTAAGRDFGEQSTIASIGKVTAATISDSVLSAAGNFNQLTVGTGLVRSSVSSGLSVGSAAIVGVIDDDTPLATDVEQNAARSGTDRELFHGHVNKVHVGQSAMQASAVTAGIDAGPDGAFGSGDDGVLFQIPGRRLPDGGGRSVIGDISGVADAASFILADSGIGKRTKFVGGNISENVSYSLEDLTSGLDAAGALEALQGVASHEVPVTHDGLRVSLDSRRAEGATVTVYDDIAGDDRIDTLVVRGTDFKSVIAVTGGGQIGRVLTGDDVIFAEFSYDGVLAGDGLSATPDLFLDGPVDVYSIGTVAAGSTARFGGNVDVLSIDNIEQSYISVAGVAGQLNIANGTGGNGLVVNAGQVPAGLTVSQVSIDSNNNTWIFDSQSESISRVDLDSGAVLQGPFATTDSFTANPIAINVMDFDFNGDDVGDPADDNLLLAVAEVFDLDPTMLVGDLADAGGTPQIRGLTVSAAGTLNAIDNRDTGSGFVDVLVTIDAISGNIQPVGEVRNVFDDSFGTGVTGEHQILQVAYSPVPDPETDQLTLLALVSDLDGSGLAATSADGVALAVLETGDDNNDGVVLLSSPQDSYSPPVVLDLDGAPVVDDFTSMAIDSNGDIWAIRRLTATSEDQLVTIALDGSVAVVGTVMSPILGVPSSTTLVGLGFNENDVLIGYNTASGAELIAVDQVDPGLSVPVSTPGLLSEEIDAFTVGGGNPVNFESFAYDTDDVAGGQFFTNRGLVSMLGEISLDEAGGIAGQFTRRAALSSDAQGTPHISEAVAMSIDNVGGGNLFLVSSDNVLREFNSADGSLLNVVGVFSDTSTGRPVQIGFIEFDEVGGDLIGGDGDLHRLVNIDTATAQVVSRTEPGSLDANISEIESNLSGGVIGIDNATGHFVSFVGTRQDVLLGLVANTIDQLNITGGNPFDSRVVTTGDRFGKALVVGDFRGSLVSADSIGSFNLIGGLAGTILASGPINKLGIAGQFETTGVVMANGHLASLNHTGGDLAGAVHAGIAGTLKFANTGLASADVQVTGSAKDVVFGGDFEGALGLGGLSGKVHVSGSLGATSQVIIGDNAGQITLAGGTEAGSKVIVDRWLKKVVVGGNHSGMISARYGVGTSTFQDVSGGLLAAGLDSKSLSVKGTSAGGVFSFGAWVGPDGIYNTDDDVITGGNLNSATFSGRYIDSVVAAGVLPSFLASSGNANNLPDDNRLYVGSSSNPDVRFVDSAEAGGVFESRIKRFTVRDQIYNSSVSTGRNAVLVAADGIDRAQFKKLDLGLSQRVYSDPLGAPTLLRAMAENDNEVHVIFSEPISTSSVVLARDQNNDGDTDDPSDVNGSIIVRDLNTGDILDGPELMLDYVEGVDELGGSLGIVRIIKSDGFSDTITLRLRSTITDQAGLATTPTLFDRSGLRSALRDLNQDGVHEVGEDVLATIFDGDLDGQEGEDGTTTVVFGDLADEFDQALAGAIDLEVDGAPLPVSGLFDGLDDVDIVAFNANAGDFFSVYYSTDALETLATMAVFVLDDQGTPGDDGDDTYEQLARYETTLDSDVLAIGDIYQAFELPEASTYFVVVAPIPGLSAGRDVFDLELRLTSTDTALAVPPDEVIAYTLDNVKNVPKQLVYLNFEGGQSDDPGFGGVLDYEAFDASVLDPTFDLDDASELIDGSDDIVSIAQNVRLILRNTPKTHPNGRLTVKVIGADLTKFINGENGIYLTTVDPSTSGEEFTEVFLGVPEVTMPGVFGMASQVDMANMNKSDEVRMFLQPFAGMSPGGEKVIRLNGYSMALANVVAHELGHVFGLNHTEGLTVLDDVNNDNGTVDDVIEFTGVANMMAAGEVSIVPDDLMIHNFVGTAQLYGKEFPRGHSDSLISLMRWLQ